MISRITLQSGLHTRLIALDNPRLTNGWHVPERDQTTALEITVASTIPYPVIPPVSDRRAA